MKIEKGSPGYIDDQKKKRILTTILLFGISFAVFLTGYLTTHTRNNLLTIIAVLGCLPAARSAVGMIILLPYHSFDRRKAEAIRNAADTHTIAYDLVLTSREHITHIDVLLISDHLICGYVSGKKTAPAEIESDLKQLMKQNRYEKVTVKIFSDYEAFSKRVESFGKSPEHLDEKNMRVSREMLRSILTSAV